MLHLQATPHGGTHTGHGLHPAPSRCTLHMCTHTRCTRCTCTHGLMGFLTIRSIVTFLSEKKIWNFGIRFRIFAEPMATSPRHQTSHSWQTPPTLPLTAQPQGASSAKLNVRLQTRPSTQHFVLNNPRQRSRRLPSLPSRRLLSRRLLLSRSLHRR